MEFDRIAGRGWGWDGLDDLDSGEVGAVRLAAGLPGSDSALFAGPSRGGGPECHAAGRTRRLFGRSSRGRPGFAVARWRSTGWCSSSRGSCRIAEGIRDGVTGRLLTKLLGPAKPLHGRLAHRRARVRYVGQRAGPRNLRSARVEPGQLTVHSDRGGPMRSKTLAQLYADLGITKTHSRPHTSNDNPFSEAQFKTLKYRPEFPQRFGSLEHARDCAGHLIGWYNTEHRHSSLAMLTPHDVHHGLAEQRLAERASVLDAAYGATPERFVHGRPKSWPVPFGSTRPTKSSAPRTKPGSKARLHPTRQPHGARVAPQQRPILRVDARTLRRSTSRAIRCRAAGVPVIHPIRVVLKATNLGVWGRAPFLKTARRLRRSTKP